MKRRDNSGARGAQHAAGLRCAAVGLGALVALGARQARAQEALRTAAATMPAPGSFIYRPHVTLDVYGTRPGTAIVGTDEWTIHQPTQIGLVKDVSLTIDAPIEFRRDKFTPGGGPAASGQRVDVGVDEVSLLGKFRFYRDDTSALDTLRAALLVGLTVQTDDRTHADEHVGVVVTKVAGRHGFNLELGYRLTTGGLHSDNLGGEGPSDAFNYNAAYLFRLAPERFSSESTGAWYATLELNGLYETNGDHELRASPGLMYEGRAFTFELGAQLPLWHHLTRRPELDFGVVIGLRLLF